MTKEQLEDAINNSSLFEMDSKSELYKRDLTSFFSILTKYYKKYVYSEESFAEKGVILILTADECLKSYKKGNSLFLHYLNTSLKRAAAKQKQEEVSGGLKIPKKEQRLLKSVKQYAKSRNLDLNDRAIWQEIAQSLDWKLEKFEELIQMSNGIVLQESQYSNENGEERSVFDMLVDKQANIEEDFIQQEGFFLKIKILEDTYQQLQERQKNLLSMLITNALCEEFVDMDKIEQLKKYAFCDESVVEHFIQNNRAYKHNEIGELLHKSESNVSRVWHNFQNKFKKNLGRQI